MQLSFSVEVERPPSPLSMYQLWYLGDNDIGAEGCRHLSRSKWNNLQTLDLCISYNIYTTTTLGLKDAAIFLSRSGTTSKHSI